MSETLVENTICILPSWYDCMIVSSIANQVIQYIETEISLLDFVLSSLYIWGIQETTKSHQINSQSIDAKRKMVKTSPGEEIWKKKSKEWIFSQSRFFANRTFLHS